MIPEHVNGLSRLVKQVDILSGFMVVNALRAEHRCAESLPRFRQNHCT
jgi:hypothetical protein